MVWTHPREVVSDNGPYPANWTTPKSSWNIIIKENIKNLNKINLLIKWNVSVVFFSFW